MPFLPPSIENEVHDILLNQPADLWVYSEQPSEPSGRIGEDGVHVVGVGRDQVMCLLHEQTVW